MYHSHLLINIGDNPDRPDWNITRKWLRNLYRVHQRLCMAFPSRSMLHEPHEQRVAAYCAPYGGAGPHDRNLPGEDDPGVLPCDAPVHSERSGEAGFLFRIDQPVDQERGVRRPVIVVQSGGDQPPDWDLAFGLDPDRRDDLGRPVGNASHLLAAPPQCRKVSFTLEGDALRLSRADRHDGSFTVQPGDRVRFRLRANPVCRRDGKRKRPQIAPSEFNAGGQRRERAFIKAHEDWLIRRLGDAAEDVECFIRDPAVERIETLVTGWAWGWRTKHEPQPSQRMQWWAALFEGTFKVRDPASLKSLLESGIGPGKAFGFGLLSVAPVAGG
ncbi:MAG TPA: type I-E CRISPR-associated protein Cas6/Cse3/CasE [Phycisphaerales bacterium]|nr:type I-E CRISPR-associated protein Cas6/Cse3/CasE [Phycisphaerales bacterium]